MKTNAARILDKAGLGYRLVSYSYDENDLRAALSAAELGVEPDRIYKTLVLKGDRTGHIVCVIPSDRELDLKKAAKASGNRSCAMLAVKDLPAATGYIRGGCSPIGMKKHFPTYIHEAALELDEIHVSAGQRGLQFCLKTRDLIAAAQATPVDLVLEQLVHNE